MLSVRSSFNKHSACLQSYYLESKKYTAIYLYDIDYMCILYVF